MKSPLGAMLRYDGEPLNLQEIHLVQGQRYISANVNVSSKKKLRASAGPKILWLAVDAYN